MNPSLQLVTTDVLFNGTDILSLISSLKPLLPLEGDQYLKKILFLLVKTALQTLIQTEAVF